MTGKEKLWLENEGKVGACDTCIFRKPIDEMNTELLPCNQYQCLVKLAKLAKGEPAQTSVENDKKEINTNDCVKNANNFNIVSRQQLPVRIMNGLFPEEKIADKFLGKKFGVYSVLEFVGYELKKIGKGRKHEGTEYVNFVFKCKCERCGSIRYVTSGGFEKSKRSGTKACPNCRLMSDDDERLIEWDN